MIARGPQYPGTARLMLEQRDLKKDLLALGLLALAVFLAAALLSYDPGDPPASSSIPQRAEVLNVCGRSGAFVSRYLFSALGLGAYYLVLLPGRARRHAPGPAAADPAHHAAVRLADLAGRTDDLRRHGHAAALAGPGDRRRRLPGRGRARTAGNELRHGRGLYPHDQPGPGRPPAFHRLSPRADRRLRRQVVSASRPKASGKACCTSARPRPNGSAASRTSTPTSPMATRPTAGPRFFRSASRGVPATRPNGRRSRCFRRRSPRRRPNRRPAPVAGARGRRSDRRAAWPRCCGSASPKAPKKDEDLQLDEPPQNAADYELPSIELLLPSETFNFDEQENEVRRKAKILEQTFKEFGFNIRVVEIQTGPVIAQFEVELEAGLRLSKITGLADDLAIALRVPSVRIVAPIPGKNTVGIEVPNTTRQIVRLREVIEEANGKAQKMRIPVYLGKDVSGNPMTVDLSTLPHLLIAGRTGTGKSVCLNSIITSMVMTRRPDEVRMLMIDPKMVELSQYKSLPHLMHPVVTDMKKAEAILAWAVEKMEERYHLLARAGVRHLSGYNQLGEEELMERIRPGERRRAPPDSHAHALYRDRGRRACRPDDDLRQGGRDAYHPPGPEEPGGRHPPRAGHAEADGRRDHRPDQVEPAGADLLPGGQPHGQPRGAGRNGGRQAAGQRRHALPLAGHEHALARAGHLPQRRRDQPRDRRRGHERAAVRQGAGATQGHGERKARARAA